MQHPALVGEPAAPHAPRAPHERGPRAGAQDGHVEAAVGLVGHLELGAAPERAGAGDDDLPGVAGERLLAVDAHADARPAAP